MKKKGLMTVWCDKAGCNGAITESKGPFDWQLVHCGPVQDLTSRLRESSAFHARSVLSPLAVTMRWPSDENIALRMSRM